MALGARIEGGAHISAPRSTFDARAEIATSFDIATGYFDIGALLALDGQWQKLGHIRILMGDEVSKRTKKALLAGLREVEQKLDVSIEVEKEKNEFLAGVPEIVEALRKKLIECRVYTKEKFHAKASNRPMQACLIWYVLERPFFGESSGFQQQANPLGEPEEGSRTSVRSRSFLLKSVNTIQAAYSRVHPAIALGAPTRVSPAAATEQKRCNGITQPSVHPKFAIVHTGQFLPIQLAPGLPIQSRLASEWPGPPRG